MNDLAGLLLDGVDSLNGNLVVQFYKQNGKPSQIVGFAVTVYKP